MQMWNMHDITTEEQARKNRESCNGKNTGVEDTSSSNDVNDVNISVESGGMVYDTTRPDNSTVSTCQCSDGSNDGCVCGMDGT